MQLIKNNNIILPAAFLAILAGLCLTLNDAAMKHLSELGYNGPFVIWFRFSMQVLVLLLIIPIASSYKKILPSQHPMLQISRSLFLLGTTGFNFLALQSLSLTLNNSIFYMAPIIITVLSTVFLKEPIGLKRVVAICAGFFGIILVVQPTGEGVSLMGVAWGFLAMLCFALYQLLSRKIAKDEGHLTSLFYMGLVAFLVLTPFAYYYYTPIDSITMFAFFIGYSFLGILAHTCIVIALSLAPAPIISSMSYFTVIFMVTMDYIIWQNILNEIAFIGVFIIISSGLFIIWRQHHLEQKNIV